jgi:Ca-activated chloride channel family protein
VAAVLLNQTFPITTTLDHQPAAKCDAAASDDGMGGGGMGGGGGGRGGMVDEMLGENIDQSGRSYYKQVWSRYRPGATRHKRPSSEQYHPIHENEFIAAVGGKAISTFSIDVDTAAYANMRRFINSGQMPPADSIRIEELVNYFQYDYPQPKGEDPFSVNMELASCPWSDGHKLLRVGLKGKEVHVKERPSTNVVYLIDVSGSMNTTAKLPLLKRGFQMMTKQLGENDRVSIVTYAGNAGVALEPTSGDNTKTINEAIERLTPGGSTHGSAGIELAYKLAQQHFITGGVNKVILATDGDLNVGVTSDNALVDLIKQKASEGVFLTVLGFGIGNLQDGKLEKLADNGNGHYAYIDSNREAHRVLVQQLSGSLVTIAKDVKIQIEFNPAEVKSYRLLGYENRILATKDFDNDQKDAGEIGAGHTVTAIYQIEPTATAATQFVAPVAMKYQASQPVPPEDKQKYVSNTKLTEAALSGELATLALRYKKPDETVSKRIEFAVKNDEKSFTTASDDFRFAASVAGFGMILRGSEFAGIATPEMVLKVASEAIGDDATGYRAEFVDLVRKAMAQ